MFFLISGKAQDLGNYQYVQVPERFEFQDSENKFQLNALTAFLFDKFNFTALYKEPVPEGVDPCEVLTAEVHDESGLFRTRLYVTLENCHNEVVFKSQTGDSREKDFKRSFPEALRNAFKSVEALDHRYTGKVVVDPSLPALDEKRDAVSKGEENKPAVMDEDEVPGKDSFQFTNGSQRYILKETASGFNLYKEGEETIFSRMIRSGRGENYLYSSGDISGNAYFDDDGNLIVEYLDSRSDQVITLVYQKS